MPPVAKAAALLCLVCLAAWLTTLSAAEPPADEAATRQYNTAAALQNRQQYDLAGDEWRKFLATWPQDARANRARYYLGVCQLMAGEAAEAEQTLAAAVAAKPPLEQLDAALLYLGLARYQQLHADDAAPAQAAADTFAQLVKQFPDSPHVARALYYQAEALYAAGQKPAAVALYQQMVVGHAADPLHADALYALGVTREELADVARAGEAYDAFLKKYPNHELTAEVAMRRGETLLGEKKFAEAERLLQQAAQTPNFALADRAAFSHAAALYHQGKYSDAAGAYRSVAEQFPQSTLADAARLAAGECHYRGESFDAAIALLKPLAQGDDDTALSAAHWLARVYLKQQQAAAALQVVERALTRAADTPLAAQLTLDRADALYEIPARRGESGEAFARLAEQFADSPLAAEAAYMAAFVAAAELDHSTALARAEAFAARHANSEWSVDVAAIAADSLLRLGRHADAERAFAQLASQYARHRQAGTWLVRRGLCSFLDRRFDQVIKLLEPSLRTLADKAARAEALYLIGSSQYELKQYPTAVKSLEASLAESAQWPQADEARLVLAFALRQQGNTAAAIAQLERLVSQHPESAALDRAWYRLGEYTLAEGQHVRAAEWFQRVIDLPEASPLLAESLLGLAWCQMGQEQFEAALAPLNRAVDLAGSGELALRARLARARALEQLEQYSRAAEDLEKLLQAEPSAEQAAEALYLLGLCQEGLGHAEQAAATYRRLLAEHPRYAAADRVWYALGWALRSQNKLDDAAEAFGRLAQDHRTSPLASEALFHVGQQHYDQEKFAEAARAFHAAMQQAGKSELGERAAHRLGWAYFRDNKLADAGKTFAFQRTTYPQGSLAADAAFMQGESAFKQAQDAAQAENRDALLREALAAYEQVDQPTSDDFATLSMLHAAQALGMLNQWDRALKWIDTALARKGESSYQAELLFERAQALLNLQRYDEALPVYEQVAERAPGELAARARFAVGEIQFLKKDHREAVRNYFKVAAYGFPQWQAAAAYESGRCFEVLGQPDQARQSYQEAIATDGKSKWAELARRRLAALGGAR